MTRVQQRRTPDDLFVIRMWPADGDGSLVHWRAQVTHVASGERHYFTNYGELCGFIDRWRNAERRSVRRELVGPA